MLANDLLGRCLMGRWDDGTRDVEVSFKCPKDLTDFHTLRPPKFANAAKM